MRFEGNNTIMCKKGSNCGCPTIHPKDEGFEITDDFGGKIKLSDDEFFMLEEAVQGYKKSKKLDKNI